MKSIKKSMTYGCNFILGYILLIHCSMAQIQSPTFVAVAPETMSSAFVRCIFKDSQGFMWFGTGNGLIRYDGTDTYRYEHDAFDKKSICNNRINTIIEDANQNLLIGTAQGLAFYDRRKDSFIDIDSIPDNKNHLNNRYITSLGIDAYGKIWIGTHGNGINIYNPKTSTFTYLSPDPSETRRPVNYVTTLLLSDNKLWVGTKAGLKLFSTHKLKAVPLPVDDKSLNSKEISQVVMDSMGSIWITTLDKEVIRLTEDKGNYQVKKTLLNQNIPGHDVSSILTISPDINGNIWVAGENSGLFFLESKSFKVKRFEAEATARMLPTNSIRSVYVDNAGIIWIGTYNKGAYLIDNNAKRFDIYQHDPLTKRGMPGNDVKALAEDKDANIWIACDDGGLCKLNPRTQQLETLDAINNQLNTKHLSALLYDHQGNLWIGTWGGGVYRLNPKTLELKNYSLISKGFGDNKVFCVYKDKNNKIWIGTVGSGLFFLDVKTDLFVSLDEQRKNNPISKTAYVTALRGDTQNNLWVGTLFGLYQLKDVGDNSYNFTWYIKNNEPGNIGTAEVLTITEDAKKNLWFGTGDIGVTMLPPNSSKFKIIQKQEGLLSNAVKGILHDLNDNVWMSGNMGLSKYNPRTNSIRNYTKDDGLPSNEFNGNAALRASDGKFYFGSDNGLIAFYPDSIRNSLLEPKVYFTDLKINNRSVEINGEDSPLQEHISVTQAIELSYNQRSFVLDFVAVNYGQSSRNQYSYKLEGFDDHWNNVGSDHTATYTNLDPGQYVFLVKAYNSDGISSKEPTRLGIIIHPAPWKTWWALLSYVIVVTSLISFLIKVRIERIKIKNQLELERLAREKAHALSESKTQFFTNISHEFRTPLSLIAMPLENLLSTNDLPEGVKERLGTMLANTDKMKRLVNELMDFNKMESAKLKLHVQQGELVHFITEIASVFKDVSAKKSIHFGVHAMVGSLEGWFDRDKLEKILVNVLSNAFKFTADNGQINLIINATDAILKEQQKSRCLELVIIDNGIGISKEELPFIFDKFYQAKSAAKIANPGTGIGLSLTKGLVELHHGTIEVESTPDHETKFIILLPIEKKIYSDDDILESPGYIVNPDLVVVKKDLESMFEEEEDPDRSQILIVEDNDELRKYISLELRHQFNILEAKNGKEGLELAFEKSPDLIISDILMPVKTGIELCNEIKSNIKTSHIPLILLTAKTTTDDQIAGLSAGADVYIAKPFSIRFLVAQVNQIISSRQKLYSRFSQDVYLLPSKVAGNEIDQAFLQKAIDYIINNIQNSQLGVDSIADLFNLSRMQVYRKIKALTGKSVVDFIRMVRIKQALKLMESEKYTLSEIAYQTGFSSASYFTRCFKDEYGKAPSEYLETKS